MRRALAAVLLTAACLGHAQVPSMPGRPAPSRVAEPERFGVLQRRIDALRAQTGCPNDYWLAKAQWWLAFARDEWHDNDRGPVVEQASDQSERIVAGIERGQVPPADYVPMIGASQRVREDLWRLLGEIERHRGFCCAQARAGELEVQLVWAGHESKTAGWRHANPYVEHAEDLAADARRQVEACPQPAAPPSAAVVPPERVTRSVQVLFRFDRAQIADAVGNATGALDEVAAFARGLTRLERVTIVGHADRLAPADYNRQLSLRRAETVRRELIARGVPADRIETRAVGAAEPLQVCPGERPTPALIDCLQPNRRVQIDVIGER